NAEVVPGLGEIELAFPCRRGIDLSTDGVGLGGRQLAVRLDLDRLERGLRPNRHDGRRLLGPGTPRTEGGKPTGRERDGGPSVETASAERLQERARVGSLAGTLVGQERLLIRREVRVVRTYHAGDWSGMGRASSLTGLNAWMPGKGSLHLWNTHPSPTLAAPRRASVSSSRKPGSSARRTTCDNSRPRPNRSGSITSSRTITSSAHRKPHVPTGEVPTPARISSWSPSRSSRS